MLRGYFAACDLLPPKFGFLRRDSILLRIVEQMQASNSHPDKRIIADMRDYSLPNGGTILPEVLDTCLRPDLVLIEEKTCDIETFELTSPADDMKSILLAEIRRIRAVVYGHH